MADQDDLAAEWGEALAEQGVAPKGGPAPAGADGAAGDDDMAAQWAAMISLSLPLGAGISAASVAAPSACSPSAIARVRF